MNTDRKLSLNLETLRAIDDQGNLEQVQGGTASFYLSCAGAKYCVHGTLTAQSQCC